MKINKYVFILVGAIMILGVLNTIYQVLQRASYQGVLVVTVGFVAYVVIILISMRILGGKNNGKSGHK